MDAPSRRQHKVAEEIAHHAGVFIAREATPQSLITVTRADISPDPQEDHDLRLRSPRISRGGGNDILKRQRTDFHDFLKEKTALRNVPTVDFVHDIGELNRQRIDELTRK